MSGWDNLRGKKQMQTPQKNCAGCLNALQAPCLGPAIAFILLP